jgi:uncharacterized damage-inducible protein DinB
MTKQDIQLLYKYNKWANKRILDAASRVTNEQFIAPASFPHGGLRGTLTHALFAEWVWRKRWLGESPTRRMKAEDFPTFDSLRSHWMEEEKALDIFVDSLTDEKLNGTFDYKTTEGEPLQRILWQAMAHVVNHGTQHRSEAAAMLTEFNHSPGDIDLILFLREMK